jgi:hypothetical protein
MTTPDHEAPNLRHPKKVDREREKAKSFQK